MKKIKVLEYRMGKTLYRYTNCIIFGESLKNYVIKYTTSLGDSVATVPKNTITLLELE